MSSPPQAEPNSAVPLVGVEWNPVIDAVWWEKERSALADQLVAEFPGFGPETIQTALEIATRRVAVKARIPNYLPVLVGREAQAWLTHRQASLQNHSGAEDA